MSKKEFQVRQRQELFFKRVGYLPELIFSLSEILKLILVVLLPTCTLPHCPINKGEIVSFTKSFKYYYC